MRIAQIAPLAESVPPKLYGGTERVVSWLTEDLVELGHTVTLFASGDSVTKASLVSVLPAALRLSRPRGDPVVAQTLLLQEIAERASEFDIIHFHTDWTHLPILTRLRVPFVTTMHGRLDLPGVAALVRRFPSAPFVSISDNQRQPLPEANWAGTVYHGMPSDLLHAGAGSGGYLAFLGRLAPEKGADTAIRLARRANVPLQIAAKIPRDASRYFKEEIQPHIDGKLISFIGEVRDAEKQGFLANASALLFPIEWPEPFGLVMIEAMACGTPVVAFSRGSVPEVIQDGRSGFVVEGEADAAAALSRIGDLDRSHVRQNFERRFNVRRMAEDYLRIYRWLSG